MAAHSGRRVGTPIAVGEGPTRKAIPTVHIDEGTRDSARRSAAGWALTQPDPAEALADVLGMLGLGPAGPARDPGRCGRCGAMLPVGSGAASWAARRGLCADCAREES